MYYPTHRKGVENLKNKGNSTICLLMKHGFIPLLIQNKWGV
nr:MAG TPA: hypothetical protein [Caudoviricetes sp.]